jgi:hypothetical protein
MNFFYDLPYDIQKKIYFEAHKLNFKDTFKKIGSIVFGRSVPPLTDLLYQRGATQKELRDYHSCLDWIDGKSLTTMEDMIENRYYDVFYDYWAAWRE